MKKIKRIFQYTYLIIFFISATLYAGLIEGIRCPMFLMTIMIISGILVFGKIIYCNIYYPNNTYLWK